MRNVWLGRRFSSARLQYGKGTGMGKLSFKAALFDMDGTLLDSMWVWERVDREFFARRGMEIPYGYLETLAAMNFPTAAVYTIETAGLKDTPESVMAEWHELAAAEYAHNIRLKPYAGELLKRLKREGVLLATASSLTPELMRVALENNGVAEMFSAFAYTGEVPRGKGFPDVYLLAAERLGVEPEECMVFEDILAGVRGAKLAGMKVCGVYDSRAFDTEKIRSEADMYINSFKELL